VLDETHYEDWLRGTVARRTEGANVQRLLHDGQFDQFQAPGLFRFLKFVEAQQRIGEDREPAAVETGDAIRLMSIHKSKDGISVWCSRTERDSIWPIFEAIFAG